MLTFGAQAGKCNGYGLERARRPVRVFAVLSDLAAVTPEQLSTIGLAVPDELATSTIPLWRSSASAKFHWADRRSTCKHLPGQRHWPPKKEQHQPPVTDVVPALGFATSPESVCRGCAASISLSAPADAFIEVAAEIVRSRKWLEAGRAGAATESWSWLQFARWKARQHFVGPHWEHAMNRVRGQRWQPVATSLRAAVAEQLADAIDVAHLLAASIHDTAPQTAVLERAIRMVETESTALEEAATILKISGCVQPTDPYWARVGASGPPSAYKQDNPFLAVAILWKEHVTRGRPADVDLIADFLDRDFPHVHDLASLPCCAVHNPPIEVGDCPHSWAWRAAQSHRRTLVEEWINRLDMARSGLLDDARRSANDPCTHLVCVPWWPLTADRMASIAYLSQFDVVCGPYRFESNRYADQRTVVARVPEWAAAHAADMASPPLRYEAIADERRQAIEMMRHAGVPVLAEEFTSRRRPSRTVSEARDALDIESRSTDHLYYNHYQHRPLAVGAVPQQPYAGEEWSSHNARWALDSKGATFVYGRDETKLLAMALPREGNWRALPACLSVEVQTSCGWSHHDDGPHMCEVRGDVEWVDKNGALAFTAAGMCDNVTIPAAYIAGITF